MKESIYEKVKKNRSDLFLLFLTAASAQSVARSDVSTQNHSNVASEVAMAEAAEGNARLQALDTLRSIKPSRPQDIERLLEAVKKSEPDIQSAAQDALKNVDAQSIDLRKNYVDMLSDSNFKVQIAGMVGSQVLNAQEAIPRIRSILLSQPRYRLSVSEKWPVEPGSLQFDLEETAMRSLIALKDKASVDDILSRDELMAATNAGSATSKTFGVEALPKLIDIAKRKDDIRHNNATQGIIDVEDVNAVPLLTQLLQDPEIRLTAVYALGNLAAKSPEAKSSLQRFYPSMSLHERAVFLQKMLVAESHWGAARKTSILPSTFQMLKDLLHDSIKANSASEYEVLHTMVMSMDPKMAPVFREYLNDPQLPQRDWFLMNRALAAWGLWKVTGETFPVRLRENQKAAFQKEWDKLEEDYTFNGAYRERLKSS